MTDRQMFPVHLPRGIDEWMKETGEALAFVVCRVEGCKSESFELVAVAAERHCRIVCAECNAVQPSWIGLHLGRIDGST